MKETPASEPRLGLSEVEGMGGGRASAKQSPVLYCYLSMRSRGELLSLIAKIMHGAIFAWSPLLRTSDDGGDEGLMHHYPTPTPKRHAVVPPDPRAQVSREKQENPSLVRGPLHPNGGWF